MIPVQHQQEPATFDAEVRQPGNAARAQGRQPLPDYWTRCIPDLHRLYGGLCCYLAVAIPPGTGSKTVDHFKPKSRYPQLAYEWDNYRLSCSLMNSRKRDFEDVLDPFALAPNSFELDFIDLKVSAAANLAPADKTAAEATIKRLKLNDAECRAAREYALTMVLTREVPFTHLQQVSPFVAHEWVRQGRPLP